MTYKKIAQILGCTDDQVEWYVHRNLPPKHPNKSVNWHKNTYVIPTESLCVKCRHMCKTCIHTPIAEREWVKNYKAITRYYHKKHESASYEVYLVLECDKYERGREPLDTRLTSADILAEIGLKGVIEHGKVSKGQRNS